MPTLIELRRRIKSVKNMQQVTKAMKTVSTARFKKAQRTIQEGRPHWHAGPALLWEAALWAGPQAHPFLAVRAEKRLHLLVVTSDKGLCGAFNSTLLAKAQEFAAEKVGRAEVRLVLIGRKAVGFFRRQPFPVDWAFPEKTDKLTEEDLRDTARRLMKKFLHQETDAVYLAYNEFKSILAPRIVITRILPVHSPEPAAFAHAVEPSAWEPGPAAVVDSLLPRVIEDQVAHAFFESQAAEQAARMIAMDGATRNAGELAHRYVLVLNKIRQAGITKELLEIMTAVEALKK
ncbi:MAG: ATP synthase F1 subunit gamma [Candidatus Aminicenantes bacterium]|nr:ATP synthase F1 subunit gamma [Candidatus Aminicenantes bacterium]